MHARCVGIDIGKRFAKVCVRVQGSGSRKTTAVVTHCGSMTNQILALAQDLQRQEVTAVAMESTGDYWKPYYYLLEGFGFEMLLANAADVKAVPGRKSDVSDAAWLADLCAHGLIRRSFVPPPPIRDLRDLTRTREQMVRDRTREANRLEKRLESPGIKLSAVLSRVDGVSARRMLRALAAGERDARVLATLAVTQLKDRKLDLLIEALTGRFTDHDAVMVTHHLDRIEDLEARIVAFDALIEEAMAPFRAAEDLLTTVPGISKTQAQNIIAEMGDDMSVFPSDKHLASWAGVAPGMNESAGRAKNAPAIRGNTHLKRALGIAALHYARHPQTHLGARYRRIARRRGKSKAIVATGNALCTVFWHMLTNGEPYQEPTPSRHDHRQPEQRKNHALRTLAELGYDIPELTLKQPA